MMNFEELKKTAVSVLGPTASAETCVRLAEALLELAPNETEYLTYTSFLKMLNKDVIDQSLILAVFFLTSSPCSILTAHGQFIDENGDEFELDDDQFQSVLTTNTVVHPRSGEIVQGAQSLVSPYFALSRQNAKCN